MIVKGVNTYLNPDSGIGLTKSRVDGNAPAARLLSKKRNDKLDVSDILKKYTDKDADTFVKKADIKQMILEISEEDKLSKYEKVQKAYSRMLGILSGEISSAKGDMEWFKRLSAEKNYYQNILNSADGDRITITNGKYLLSDLDNGTVVSRKDIEECIAYVERKIQNDLIAKKDDMYIGNGIGPFTKEEISEWLERSRSEVIIPDKINSDDIITDEHTDVAMKWARQDFNSWAEELEKATGMKFGVDDDDPMFSKEGYTEENFLEKTQQRINLLTAFSNALRRAMRDYMKMERAAEAYEVQKDITAQLSIYFRHMESVSEIIEDFDKAISENSEKIAEME